ncbi:hypothetical protein GCM10022221_63090 [Actinocorallia aurea]
MKGEATVVMSVSGPGGTFRFGATATEQIAIVNPELKIAGVHGELPGTGGPPVPSPSASL